VENNCHKISASVSLSIFYLIGFLSEELGVLVRYHTSKGVSLAIPSDPLISPVFIPLTNSPNPREFYRNVSVNLPRTSVEGTEMKLEV
jgi:hypothetical protein